MRSSTGNRDDVVLDGNYQSGSIIFIDGADDITIAELMIRRSYYHLVHVTGEALRTKLYNLKLD